MPTEPPPSRFRVVERGRRLEVIDTHPGTSAPRPAAPTKSELDLMREDDTRDLRFLIARGLALGAIDELGRPLLSTASWWDERGPRTVALPPPAARQLGATTLGIVVAAVTLLIFTSGFALALAPVALAAVNSRAVAGSRAGSTATRK